MSPKFLERVHDFFFCTENSAMRKTYASDVSREKFEEIRPLLRTGCQWRFLPSEFPKWRTVHSYFAKWSEPDQDGISVLERALKKSGWRGPYQTGAQRLHDALDR